MPGKLTLHGLQWPARRGINTTDQFWSRHGSNIHCSTLSSSSRRAAMSGSAKLDSYSEDASVNLETFSPRGCSSLAYTCICWCKLRGVSNLKLKRSPRAPRCTRLHFPPQKRNVPQGQPLSMHSACHSQRSTSYTAILKFSTAVYAMPCQYAIRIHVLNLVPR